ncbi:hypothetical protein [Nocardia takedensis]|uniref:hypothetical protein n=2 Tax=Nocardia takedensis TaxID=259390 RepID=UPI001FE0BC4C|nr:hypothetical protein [Nocardia takedensis]
MTGIRDMSARDRVAGADESYLLAERLFGMSAPIQYAWVFPEQPDGAALTAFSDQLAAGMLSRKMIERTVPFARHRWVRSPHPPSLRIQAETIPDDGIGAWTDRTLREAALDPVGGRGWKLVGARTDAGRFVLCLLISHMVADGQGLYNALAAAHAGTSVSTLPTQEQVRGTGRVAADLRDAAGQLRAAAAAGRVLVTALWRARDMPRPAARSVPRAVAPPTAGEPDTTLAIVDVDRHAWTRRAKEAGGTGNGLFTAVLCGLVRRSRYPVGEDGTRVCIAVSNREDGDDRANASGGVWIRVPGAIGPDTGLGEVRTLSKRAFTDYARSRADAPTDNLQAVVRLLPRPVIARLMRGIAGPDTTVSNLGAAPDSALEIGGRRAESFAIRAIMQGRRAADRRAQGPAVAAWAVEYDDKITLTFFGIHPDHFGDPDRLRDDIAAELADWGLTGRPW